MKIGLIRHFKVRHPFPQKKLLTKAEVIAWFDGYNTADVEIKDVDLYGIQWKQCYSSPHHRAINTARQIYNGEIVTNPALKELEILHRLPDRTRLPFMVWGILVRIKSFASNRDTDEFNRRITNFVDELLQNHDSNTLVVSHWFVMRVIRYELLRRGLIGDNLKTNEYGRLYVYESKV